MFKADYLQGSCYLYCSLKHKDILQTIKRAGLTIKCRCSPFAGESEAPNRPSLCSHYLHFLDFSFTPLTDEVLHAPCCACSCVCLQRLEARAPAPVQTTCSPAPPPRCPLHARTSPVLCVRTSPQGITTASAPVRAAR